MVEGVGGAAGSASEMKLEFTPTWIVDAVCSFIVFISLVVERLLHHLFLPEPFRSALHGQILLMFQVLKRNNQTPVFDALQKGKVPLLSLEAIHHLPIFIFVLAVTHVAFSILAVLLGGAKIRQWKHWEGSIQNKITGDDSDGMDGYFNL